MRETMRSRIEVLERGQPEDSAPMFIFIHSIDVGTVGAPSARASYKGISIHRRDEESNDAFIQRVQDEVEAADPEKACYMVFVYGPEEVTA